MMHRALVLGVFLAVLPTAFATEAAVHEQQADEHSHDKNSHDEHNHDDHSHDEDSFTALGSHVHGSGLLTLVIEGNEMQLAFQAPAFSVLGFEHKAVTAEQQQEVNAAIAVFNKGEWFSLNSEAACERVAAEASTDLNSSAQAAGHADFYANYQLLCQSPARLKSVTLSVFSLLPTLQNIDVQWVVNDTQGATQATLSNAIVVF